MTLVRRSHAVDTHVLGSVWRLAHGNRDCVGVGFVVQSASIEELSVTYLRLDELLFKLGSFRKLVLVVARVHSLSRTMALE